ncbi:MAG: ComF family protein [Clostridia bacterium]|nr:ComF family protein [Clostridia bacterium]
MLFKRILRLLFPERCRCCGKLLVYPQEALCPACRSEYESAKKRLCAHCKRPYTECRCRPDEYSGAVAEYACLFKYRKDLLGGALILSLKRRKDREAAKILALDMAKLLKRRVLAGENTVVTYLPRGRSAVAETGTDQSYVLAKRTAKYAGMPFMKTLKRRRNTGKEQKELTKAERVSNADASFAFAGDHYKVAGKRVILVDDITTTGASCAACARILKENGARDVVVLTPGRA